MLLSIPNKIKMYRLSSGYSLRKLAEISGTNYSTISKIENDVLNVHPTTARKLCHALNIEISEIFTVTIEK